MTSRFATLAEWLQWQESLHPNAIDLGLERVRSVAACLFGQDINGGKPLTITVAGTNGKGSCVKTLSVLLAAAGKKVGAFSSPHLRRYNERICINNVEVSDEELCAAFTAIDEARHDISLTYFEFNALAALWLFRQHTVDVQVLEVGLGGRLDAVNIVDADIAIITNIALDHVDWLGDTREKIGTEKAGILRRGGKLVYGEWDMPQSIRQYAAQLHVDVRQCGEHFHYAADESHMRWTGQNAAGGNISLMLSLPSLPLPSVACALQVLAWLDLPDLPDVCSSAQVLRLPGRFERHEVAGVHYVFDVAHNPAGAQFLALQLSALCLDIDVCLVAIMADKDFAGMIAPLLHRVKQWIPVVLQGNPRAASVDDLRHGLLSAGVVAEKICPACAPGDCANRASAWQGKTVLVFGSFYSVEAVRRVVLSDE